MLPLSGLLERLVQRLVPDGPQTEAVTELDQRLLLTPHIALERCREVAADMARTAVEALKEGLTALETPSTELAASVRNNEERTDHYEDILGTYLVQLSTRPISSEDSAEAAKLLKMIGDFERISDHAVNLVESAEEMGRKQIAFPASAANELNVITSAVREILDLALDAFLHDDLTTALSVEPLEQVIDQLKETLRTRHILRLQQGECSIDVGFVWSDLLTDLERTADHCSNIAGCVIDMAHNNMNLHESLRELRNDSGDFRTQFRAYSKKYTLAE
jgi:phosphate:Na+ symporter